MTVKEIVENWLKENGYDGLLDDCDDCECKLADGSIMSHCDEDGCGDCEPGYLFTHPQGSYISLKKMEVVER